MSLECAVHILIKVQNYTPGKAFQACKLGTRCEITLQEKLYKNTDV